MGELLSGLIYSPSSAFARSVRTKATGGATTDATWNGVLPSPADDFLKESRAAGKRSCCLIVLVFSLYLF